MSKPRQGSLLLGIAWTTGLAVVIALLSLIAGAGVVPRWAVVALGSIGFVSFAIVAAMHGWLKAPYPLGTPLRAIGVVGAIAFAMFFLCKTAWPPIRRHVLDDEEKGRFEEPLKRQTNDRYEIQLACPSADEATCVYAAQFINLFREAGWKVQNNQVQRVVLGVPYDGVRLFSYVAKYPEPDAPVDSGVWTKITPSLISVYKSFSAIGIEPDSGIRNDMPENVLTVYFGSEKADESIPTGLTKMYGKIPEIKHNYPDVKLP